MNTTSNTQAKPAKKLMLNKESIRLLNSVPVIIGISIDGCSIIVC